MQFSWWRGRVRTHKPLRDAADSHRYDRVLIGCDGTERCVLWRGEYSPPSDGGPMPLRARSKWKQRRHCFKLVSTTVACAVQAHHQTVTVLNMVFVAIVVGGQLGAWWGRYHSAPVGL